MVPCPPRNAPELTTVCALAIDPSTISLPLFTVVDTGVSIRRGHGQRPGTFLN